MSTQDLFGAISAPTNHYGINEDKNPPCEHQLKGEVKAQDDEPLGHTNLEQDAPASHDQGSAVTLEAPSAEDTPTDNACSMLRPMPKNVQSRIAGDVVVCSTPPETFAEAIALITASGTVDADRLAAFRREVTWVQTRLPRHRDGSPAAPLPCAPTLLRPVLQSVSPGKHKISAKRWYNIRSELAAIQHKTGWLPPRAGQVTLRSPKWAHGLALLDQPQTIAMFRNFAAFCEGLGVEPDQVEPQHLDAYREHLITSAAKLKIDSSLQALRYTWNRLLRHHPDWGGKKLPAKRNPLQLRGDKNDLPREFYDNLDAYCAKLAKPGIFPKGFPARTAPRTIESRRKILILSAFVLRQNGWAASQIASLRDLTSAAAVEIILTAYHTRNCGDGQWTLGAEATAAALKAAAREWAKLPADELTAMAEICDSVRAPKTAFPKKARERLAQFDDKGVERRFWALPETIWTDAQKHERKGRKKRAADLAKYALALAIAFDKPLRVTNLAHLDLKLDFEHDRHGAIIGIRIEGERTTKNAPIIEGALSPRTQQMLKIFLEKYRPRLLKGSSTALFPGQAGNYVDAKSLGRHLKTLIDRYLGITVNVHLIRALISTIILDEDPRAVVLAQRMLDHRSSTTTVKSYAQQRGRAVQGQYAEIMHRRIRKLQK
ncbi:MAG: integrase [Acidocella sp.]|uniref:tyrosine-type recombinase/integrase n=1 Tax=Acidocella sp. TaxID=50710 RepID=UPI003FD8B1C9